MLGPVDANRRHYELAASALSKTDRAWLAKLVSRKVPLSRYRDAFERPPHDVKVVLDMRA